MIRNESKNRKTPRLPKKTSHLVVSEEVYSEINSKSFFQNFQILIHHYKKEDEPSSKK